MDILNFEKKHVKEATEIALANYYDERQFVKELPQVSDIPDLNDFARNGLGVAAFENQKMKKTAQKFMLPCIRRQGQSG